MIVSRLAPTPNGYIHLGNLMNFAMIWAMVRKSGGKLWLRLDDHDQTRVREEYIQDILETLKWMGLDWDEQTPSQATRTAVYRQALDRLDTYVCTCTRTQIAERTHGGEYDGHCRDLALAPSLSPQRRWRSPDVQNDVVLWRRDDLPGYHIVSVVDDEEAGVNLVVRGKDLFESTQTQLALAKALNFNNFLNAQFIHHELISDDGEKLAKSRGSHSLCEMRAEGQSPGQIWQHLALRAGWPSVKAPRDLLNVTGLFSG